MKIKLPFKKPNLKINWDGVSTNIVTLGVVGVAAFVGIYWGFSRIGLFSYNALPKEHVDAIYKDFLTRYKILSRVHGHLPLIGYFERGIVTGPDGSPGYPLYFHYWSNGDDANFQMYPMMFETWTTSSGLGLGKLFTGKPI
jgi:hypothetical protein